MALIQDSTDPRFLSQYAGGSSPAIPATPVATNIPVSEITPTNPMTVPVSNSGLNDFNAIMAGTNVSLPVPVNPEEAAVKKNQSDILSKMTELGGAGAYQAELESDPTLQGNKKDLMDLQSQLMSLNNEAQAAALNVDRQGRPAVLTAAANLEKGNIERDRTIKALRLSSSIQALQGNISLAQDQIDTAIKRKYEPIKAQLDVLNKQLEFNYDTFTAAEKKRADQLKFENDIKMDEINQREEADKRFESFKIQALSNGMSATQAQQAQALYEAGQSDQAYANMSRYTGSKSSDVNTSTSDDSSPFTKSQINAGAAIANISIEDFKRLDQYSQNFFINNKNIIKSELELIKEDKDLGEDPREREALIEELDIPEAVKDTLTRNLKQTFAEEYASFNAPNTASEAVADPNMQKGYQGGFWGWWDSLLK